MNRTTRLAITVFAILVASLRAADNAPEPVSLTNGRKAYEQECARAIEPVTTRYVRWLENSKREYGAKGDVASALSFENEINRVVPQKKQQTADKAPVKPDCEDARQASDAAIAGLPPEDQQIARALKFSGFEAVRFSGTTFNNSEIKVTNRTPRNDITDKLTAEVRFLCKSKDGQWSVCRGKAKINVTEKGTQLIKMGGLGSASEMRDRNGGQPEPYDAHITVRYLDTVVYTSFWKNRKGAPDKWESDDALIFSR